MQTNPASWGIDNRAGIVYNANILRTGENVGNKVRLTVLTPRDLHEAAKAKAAAEDVTISQLVRWWLRAWVDGDLPARPPGLQGTEP